MEVLAINLLIRKVSHNIVIPNRECYNRVQKYTRSNEQLSQMFFYKIWKQCNKFVRGAEQAPFGLYRPLNKIINSEMWDQFIENIKNDGMTEFPSTRLSSYSVNLCSLLDILAKFLEKLALLVERNVCAKIDPQIQYLSILVVL